jgi:hypothetical protein
LTILLLTEPNPENIICVMPPDRRGSRRAREEESEARWGEVVSWLDQNPGLRELRLEALDDRASILIGKGLESISHAEGLPFLRPDLVDIRQELMDKADNASKNQLRRSGSPDYLRAQAHLVAIARQ